MGECKTVNNLVTSSLPAHILVMSPLLVENFVGEISSYLQMYEWFPKMIMLLLEQ
jgi:hypothetical protein